MAAGIYQWWWQGESNQFSRILVLQISFFREKHYSRQTSYGTPLISSRKKKKIRIFRSGTWLRINRSFAQNGCALPWEQLYFLRRQSTTSIGFFFFWNNFRAFMIAYAALSNKSRYRRVSRKRSRVPSRFISKKKKKTRFSRLLPRSAVPRRAHVRGLSGPTSRDVRTPWTLFDFPLTVVWNATRSVRSNGVQMTNANPVPRTVYIRIEFVIRNIPRGICGLLPLCIDRSTSNARNGPSRHSGIP